MIVVRFFGNKTAGREQYAGRMVLQTHSERRKSRYDEMAVVEDSIQADEWHDLAHTVLVFVRYEYSLTYHC